MICSTICRRVGAARSGPASPRRRPAAAPCSTNSSKRSGPVVQRGGQPEAVLHERLLARAVALVHAADLRHGLVGLVDEEQEVVAGSSPAGSAGAARPARGRRGSASSSRCRCSTRPPASSPCRTPCAAPAAAPRAACPASSKQPDRSSAPRWIVSSARSIARPVRDVVRRREHGEWSSCVEHLAGQRVECDDLLDLVAEELDAHGGLVRRPADLDDVAADAEACRARGSRSLRCTGCRRACAAARRGRARPRRTGARSCSRTPRASRGRRCSDTLATMTTSSRAGAARWWRRGAGGRCRR